MIKIILLVLITFLTSCQSEDTYDARVERLLVQEKNINKEMSEKSREMREALEALDRVIEKLDREEKSESR